MTTEKMSLTEALVQLKILDKRITKEITNSKFVSFGIGIKTENIDAVNSLASIRSLQKRREAIQNAKIMANAITKIKVAGNEMTIMEAIEKKSSIKFDEMLLNAFRNQLSIVQDEMNYENSRVQDRLDKQLEEAYGKSGKIREEDYKSISEPFLKNNAAVIVDPIDIKKKIDTLDLYIDEFKGEVDIRLSEINARTIISVTY